MKVSIKNMDDVQVQVTVDGVVSYLDPSASRDVDFSDSLTVGLAPSLNGDGRTGVFPLVGAIPSSSSDGFGVVVNRVPASVPSAPPVRVVPSTPVSVPIYPTGKEN